MEQGGEIHEIRVFFEGEDPLANSLGRQAQSLSGKSVDLQTKSVYYTQGLTDEATHRLANGLLADPTTQSYAVGQRTDWDNGQKIEVASLPGVMNPEVAQIIEGATELGVYPTALETGTEHVFRSGTPDEVSSQVVGSMLVNTTVQHVRKHSPDTLLIEGEVGPVESISIRNLDEDGLKELSQSRKLALNLKEMQAIQKEASNLGRDMTDVEVEYLAAAWSEHCCHKTFNADIEKDGEVLPSLFSRIKDISTPHFEERGVISAFHDNSGVWRFYDGQALCVKLETHNSPMNLEPYGGAATGTGGVLRDIAGTGTGAKVINSQHMQFLAPLNQPPEDIPPGCHSSNYLLTRSVAGVGDYGNQVGVPTNNGSFHTHPNYRGKGSILVGALGIMPEQNAQKGIPEYDDLVVAVGGRTGRDGLHGATFSSESADSSTATLHSGAVQIGDPITEKKMFDALLEASEAGLIRAVTDCGAAGFASAVGEMGEEIGVVVDLVNAPLKYEGLSPWEIFLSESQERMVLAVDPSKKEELESIFAKHGSEAVVLGTFGSPKKEDPALHVLYAGETVANLSYKFIKGGLPDDAMKAEWIKTEIEEVEPLHMEWVDLFKQVLSNGNVCSKEPLIRKYDHEVQGTNALKPYGGVNGDGPNDAAVMTPVLGKPYAVIEAHGCNPTLSDLDPRYGSIWSYVEAVSNLTAAGGNPDDIVVVNNYISATPTPRVLGALSESVDALIECVDEFRSPIISGKDSLSSTFKFPDGEILESPYNLIVTVAGKIPDVAKTVSSDIKKPRSKLVLIGKQDLDSMGGSVYYEEAEGRSANVPQIDIKKFHKTATALHEAIQTGKVLSAHDVSEGGIAVAVSEMLFGGDCGADLYLTSSGRGSLNELFNETAGCFVVEVENDETARKLFPDNSIGVDIIGSTKSDKTLSAKTYVPRINKTIPLFADLSVEELKAAWKKPLEELFS